MGNKYNEVCHFYYEKQCLKYAKRERGFMCKNTLTKSFLPHIGLLISIRVLIHLIHVSSDSVEDGEKLVKTALDNFGRIGKKL